MLNFNTNTNNHDEWLTPPEIVEALGPFDLDPCAPVDRPWPTAAVHYTKEQDGLSLPWKGRVWLNPPYGRETFHWLARLADHGWGTALIFARTETNGFHDFIWNRAHAVFFFRGRLKFYRVDGTQAGAANAPSCLVSYSVDDTCRIMQAMKDGKLNGVLVRVSDGLLD